MAGPTIHQSQDGSRNPGAESGALHLTVMGPNVFQTFPLPTSGPVKIGRDEHEAKVRITDELASRVHACLHVGPAAQLFIEDLGSSNGTFVRGDRIEPGKRIALAPGEAITIGFTHLMVQRRRPRVQQRRFHSHGAFEERLEDACERAGESGVTFAVGRLQIDDEEPAGRGVDLINGALRQGDFLAQYAPGDYEVLLLDTDAERARSIAEELARRIRTEGLTVRAAVAAYPGDGRSAEALIGSATASLRGAEPAGTQEPVLKSDTMRRLYRQAELAAASVINVLILGETGVGKEVLADWVHRHSPRASKRFICINCAALSETLLESELFGHEKGAFTGATASKPGLLEAAAGGTVFLDEIGEMPPLLQTKLLRALENRQVTRVGGLEARKIDVRFVAATNRDLDAEVASKGFRSDLYFRLNGISLTIPALRERPDEIEPLARKFLADAAAMADRRAPRLSPEALEILRAYSWPGNIRELRNVIDRAVVLCEGSEITTEQLPVEKMRLVRFAPGPATPPMPMAAVAGASDGIEGLSPTDRAERQRILEVLATCGFNQTRAAKKLGMARGTLIERMKRYAIKRPQSDEA